MAVNVDKLFDRLPEITQARAVMTSDRLEIVECAEERLLLATVLQREGAQCDTMLRVAKAGLGYAYMIADLAQDVESADALVEKFQQGLNRVVNQEIAQQKAREAIPPGTIGFTTLEINSPPSELGQGQGGGRGGRGGRG